MRWGWTGCERNVERWSTKKVTTGEFSVDDIKKFENDYVREWEGGE